MKLINSFKSSAFKFAIQGLVAGTMPVLAVLAPNQAAAQNTESMVIAGAAIGNRLEQLLGGVGASQRDVARQAAESYVAQSRAAQTAEQRAGATAQFDRVIQTNFNASQYQAYQTNREFVLTGQGQLPGGASTGQTGQRSLAEAGSAIALRIERALGALGASQREELRQAAESLAGQRREAQGDAARLAAADQQFESVLKRILNPTQFQQYLNNRSSFLYGPNGQNGQGTRRNNRRANGQQGAVQGNQESMVIAGAAIGNRLEQLLGGVGASQRDVARQAAESYVAQSRAAQTAEQRAGATAQFDRVIQTNFNASQYQAYQTNREFVLTGQGQLPGGASTGQTGQRSLAEAGSAIALRIERALGALGASQREELRQAAESLAGQRREAQGDAARLAAADQQFESVLKRILNPTQFQQYLNNRSSFLYGPNGQ
ncbi:hypothetical protein [uncultured Hymenobacter sp.]|uniref:hypothetical protein n=1 Tax=uncultured Hymenobacter sp. TaxID=170016 RepID=UPI0035C94A40